MAIHHFIEPSDEVILDNLSVIEQQIIDNYAGDNTLDNEDIGLSILKVLYEVAVDALIKLRLCEEQEIGGNQDLITALNKYKRQLKSQIMRDKNTQTDIRQ